ncbi:MAG: putative guanosine polyphosphate pyrophosphohydrolase/synthetase [Actinomycetota bacterium]
MTGNRNEKLDPRWRADGLLAGAFDLAARLHAGQVRKGTDIPYISHLMAVSSMVTQYGGSDVQAAAGLLHDSIEDAKQTLALITAALHDDGAVGKIVEDCSDDDGTGTSEQKALRWTVRKQAYLEKLEHKNPSDPSLLVSLCDKIHNCESSADDLEAALRNGGSATRFWSKFNAGDACQQWYYERLYEEFEKKLQNADARPAILRFRAAIDRLFGDREIEPCATDHSHAPARSHRSAQ